MVKWGMSHQDCLLLLHANVFLLIFPSLHHVDNQRRALLPFAATSHDVLV